MSCVHWHKNMWLQVRATSENEKLLQINARNERVLTHYAMPDDHKNQPTSVTSRHSLSTLLRVMHFAPNNNKTMLRLQKKKSLLGILLVVLSTESRNPPWTVHRLQPLRADVACDAWLSGGMSCWSRSQCSDRPPGYSEMFVPCTMFSLWFWKQARSKQHQSKYRMWLFTLVRVQLHYSN